MKTLILRQLADIYGPWRPVTYQYMSPMRLLQTFGYKPTLWEMTMALEADWRITPILTRDSYVEKMQTTRHLYDLYSNDVSPYVNALSDLRIDDYDVVITCQPFLSEAICRKATNTLFAYLLHEHNNHEYPVALSRPAPGYDIFLDHMCGTVPPLSHMGDHVIEWPYLRCVEHVRGCYTPQPGRTKSPAIFIEARTLIAHFTGSERGLWTDELVKKVSALARQHDIEIIYRADMYRSNYRVQNPPNFTDATGYYENLAKAGGYIALAAAGAGQALVDAASLGHPCIGNQDLVYHRLTCHPKCFAGDLDSAIAVMKGIMQNDQNRRAIVTHQDKQLNGRMNAEPLAALRARLMHRPGRQPTS